MTRAIDIEDLESSLYWYDHSELLGGRGLDFRSLFPPVAALGEETTQVTADVEALRLLVRHHLQRAGWCVSRGTGGFSRCRLSGRISLWLLTQERARVNTVWRARGGHEVDEER